jgi:CRP/FNR family transcriptional regulator, anaerobic regulatory protein
MSWTAAVPALSGLAPEAVRRLQALVPMDVPAGTVLFRPGDAVRGYVIVLDGRIGVHLIGPNGRDILLYDVVPGKTCIQSTLGLLGGDDYTAEAVAERPSRLVLLPRETFLDLLGSDAAFRTLVFAAFAERMQSMMHLLEKVAFRKVEARLAAWLLSRAESGTVRATQQDMASGIGSAREVVSRRLDSLARQGAIAHSRGRVTILDAGALRRLADEPVL